jgi:hypothetical protein
MTAIVDFFLFSGHDLHSIDKRTSDSNESQITNDYHWHTDEKNQPKWWFESHLV